MGVNMKIGTAQSNNFIKASTDRDVQEKTNNKKDGKSNSTGQSRFYAGNLNLNQDIIAARKINGQKQAIRTILGTFTKELNMDCNMDELRKKQDSIRADMSVYYDKLNSVQKMKDEIRKGYGVSESSEEEKDVNLIIKGMYNSDSLTDDEKQRLKEIGPLTDYQKEILECSKMENFWSRNLQKAQETVNSISWSVNSIQLERDKIHPVLDAKEAAEKILEAASQEVVGLLVEESKEKIDEDLNNKDDAEEAAEKADKKNNKDADGIDTAEAEDLMNSYNAKQEELLKKLKKQANISNVLMDELKGIFLDLRY